VIREPDGRYYASFVVERTTVPLSACDREIGVDLGLNSLIVTSDGGVIPNPRFLRKASKRLRRAQRVLSRRQEGSANRARARHRVAVLHRKVRETRLDHVHKTALRLVRDNQAVFAEDLAVSGLMRTRLARSVSDAGWSQLMRCLEEKAAQYGRTFARIGRFEPTSPVCSACGVKDGPKPLASLVMTATSSFLPLPGRSCRTGIAAQAGQQPGELGPQRLQRGGGRRPRPGQRVKGGSL
jgi:putative transposase